MSMSVSTCCCTTSRATRAGRSRRTCSWCSARRSCRDNWLVWREGKAPDFVLEVTSRRMRRRDEGPKRGLYRRFGVAEYWQYDPTGDYLDPRLKGARLTCGGYRPIPAGVGAGGVRYVSRVLGLELRLVADTLRFYDPSRAEYLPTPEEETAEHGTRPRGRPSKYAPARSPTIGPVGRNRGVGRISPAFPSRRAPICCASVRGVTIISETSSKACLSPHGVWTTGRQPVGVLSTLHSGRCRNQSRSFPGAGAPSVANKAGASRRRGPSGTASSARPAGRPLRKEEVAVNLDRPSLA